MADASVLMLLDRLAPKIEKAVREEVCLILNSNDEALNLSSKLKKIQQVLMDAEQKAVMDPRVKSWLDKLQDISYDIDAVLDEWDLLNLNLELEDASESSDSLLQKVSAFLQSVCLCFRKSVERRTIAKEMKKLNERLDLIAQENEKEFNFIPNLSRESQDFKRIISTSVVDVSEVLGRVEDLKLLMKKLVPESGIVREDDIQIVSLVGMGGMGKTSLTQLAFNRDEVKAHFEVKMWVCVSHPFDEIKIAKAILESLNGSSPNLSQFETLVKCIKDSVSGKRFLLVLDDVWTEDDTMWKPLKTTLMQSGAPGSRILLTTRSRKVLETMGSNQMLSLDVLSDWHCWSILSQIAFAGRNEGDCEMLKETSWEIALKCKGLPLAAKTLGSLLRFKSSLEEWQNVLNSELWVLENVRTEVFPFLALSYNELHPVVKLCFSYCAIFPKDSILDVDELIRSWMAQGFISSSGTEDEMEIKGRYIFNDLANRSFFQDFESAEYMDHHIIRCKMHHILHDFTQFLTKNECLIVENIVGEAKRGIVSNKSAHHLNLVRNETMNSMDLFSICQAEKLRSFLFLGNEISLDFLSHLKRVRWLRLHKCNLLDIPSEIGDLVRIRYLDLSYNPMKELPETICDLYNLQALNIKDCDCLSELPRGINKLKNLRYLLINGTTEMFFTQGLEKLGNLREFDYFCYNRKSKNKLGHLKDLSQLRGSLMILIFDLDDANDHLVEAKLADLKNKKFIQYLSLCFDEYVGLEIIDALQPSPNLPCLRFIGDHLPNWITTLTNLRELFIYRVRNGIQVLHSLRNLPFLEELTLFNFELENLSLEFFGIHKTSATTKLTSSCELLVPSAFPKLKKFCIHVFLGLKEWEDIGEEDGDMINISILPCLQVLKLNYCPELRALPHRLLRMALSLQKLDIEQCKYLRETYHKETGKGWDKISHIPNVRIS